jgi:hypothetical protein
MWSNLIKVSVPTVSSSGPLVFTNHFMIHSDVISEITLGTRAIVSEFDLKTWGFLMCPDHSDYHSLDFDILVRQILMDGILPLAQHYFQGYLYPCGPAHQVYCHRFLEFAKAQLKAFASSWRLMEHLIGIRTDGM